MSEVVDHAPEPSPRALALAARVRWALVVLALGLAVLGVVLGAGWFSSPDASGAYTCPMHPEIRARAPGTCPICQNLRIVRRHFVSPSEAVSRCFALS